MSPISCMCDIADRQHAENMRCCAHLEIDCIQRGSQLDHGIHLSLQLQQVPWRSLAPLGDLGDGLAGKVGPCSMATQDSTMQQCALRNRQHPYIAYLGGGGKYHRAALTYERQGGSTMGAVQESQVTCAPAHCFSHNAKAPSP